MSTNLIGGKVIKLGDKFRVLDKDYFNNKYNRYGIDADIFETLYVKEFVGTSGDVVMSNGFRMSIWEIKTLAPLEIVGI